MIFELAERKPVFAGEYYVADTAVVVGAVRLGRDVSIWFNAVLRADNDLMTVGDRCNIQDGAVLHVDPGAPLTLGSDVSVGHKAMLHGCTVGENTLIGINAVVLNHAVIGRNCIVGAGALVTEGKRIPDGSLVVGAPARVHRAVRAEEIAAITRNAEHYVANAGRYRTGLRRGP